MNLSPLNLLENHFYKLFDMSVEEQTLYLEALQKKQPKIAQDLRDLLDVTEASESLFEQPIMPISVQPLRYIWRVIAQEPYKPPTQIGQYKIESVLGSGGMGIVYKGVRLGDYHKEVALKVLRSERKDTLFSERFRSEIRALALMAHENIAHFYDADTTEGKEFYMVMEYIPGQPIHHFCKEHSLDLSERLRLFEQVCDGVRYAHSRGVLHGDLKPMNILVVNREDGARVKIIDFGVAQGFTKATEHLNDQMDDYILGSPFYMSPQQAKPGTVLDVRCDIFALGVIFFELITGFPPLYLDQNETLERTLEAIRNRPRLRMLQAVGQASADALGVPLKKLQSIVVLDLDWITQKALALDPEERYETVNELRTDLRRFQSMEPIAARPHSLRYRFNKWRKRERWRALSALIGVAATLIIFLSVLLALKRSEEARRSWENIGKTHEFYNELVSTAQPNVSGGDVKFKDVLVYWESSLASLEDVAPEQAANLYMTLGNACISLGLYERAEAQLIRALLLRRKHLGPSVGATLVTLERLAYAEIYLRKYQSATLRFQALLKEAGRNEAVYHDAVRGLLYLNITRHHMAEAGELAQGMELRLPELKPKQQQEYRAILALYYERINNFFRAEELYTEVQNENRRIRGEQDPETLISKHELARFLFERGDFLKALPLYQEVANARRSALGDLHPFTLKSEHGVILCYWRLKDYEEVIHRGESLLNVLELIMGKNHPQTLEVFNTLSDSRGKLYGSKVGRASFSELVGRYRSAGLLDSDLGLMALNNLADYQMQGGDQVAALKSINECLSFKRQKSTHSVTLLTSIVTKGEILEKGEKRGEAYRQYQEAYLLARDNYREEPKVISRFGSYFTEYLLRRHLYEEAVTLLCEVENFTESDEETGKIKAQIQKILTEHQRN